MVPEPPEKKFEELDKQSQSSLRFVFIEMAREAARKSELVRKNGLEHTMELLIRCWNLGHLVMSYDEDSKRAVIFSYDEKQDDYIYAFSFPAVLFD